jgi:hypothetical protein
MSSLIAGLPRGQNGTTLSTFFEKVKSPDPFLMDAKLNSKTH